MVRMMSFAQTVLVLQLFFRVHSPSLDARQIEERHLELIIDQMSVASEMEALGTFTRYRHDSLVHHNHHDRVSVLDLFKPVNTTSIS
jgi:hypothetical protein